MKINKSFKILFHVMLLLFSSFLLLFLIVFSNYLSFNSYLDSFNQSFETKSSNDLVSYVETDIIYSKSNSERILLESKVDNLDKVLFLFKDVPYIYYNGTFFSIDNYTSNSLEFNDKIKSLYVFDFYKDILNILFMFVLGLFVLFIVKIRVKYLKYEDGFKNSYNLSLFNKNIYFELSYLIIAISFLVHFLHLFLLNLNVSSISILSFVLIYAGYFMFKEFQVRKIIFSNRYNSYLNNLKIDVENSNKVLKKSLIKKYKKYNFDSLLIDYNDINISDFKSYLINHLIDIDKLNILEKSKIISDYLKSVKK